MIFFFVYNSIFLFLTEYVPLTFVVPIDFTENSMVISKFSIYLICCLHAGIFYYLYYKSVELTEKELIDSRNAAEAASRTKKDFLASMSHEIRTPLNAVVSISTLLSQKNEEEQEELIGSLKFSAGHLMNIINEILDFSKLEAGKIFLDRNPINLKELVNNICKSYSVIAEEKGLKMHLEIANELHETMLLDEVRLTQVISNLLNNALKFTHSGEVRLRLSLQDENEEHQEVKFSIIDTGIGIPEEEVSSIFSSFTQVSNNFTKKYEGSGLGLTIVVEILKLFDSTLAVESTLGVGSTFSFVTSLEKTNLEVQKEEEVATDSFDQLQILVVEDYSLNALVIKKTLAGWGIAVEIANSGKEALEKFQPKIFDLILMDIHMPEMDGIETTRRLKKMPLYDGTPIYALTADITAALQEDIMLNFAGFLSKPLEREKIKKVLANYAPKSSG